MVSNGKPVDILSTEYWESHKRRIDCLVSTLAKWDKDKTRNFLKEIAYRAPEGSKEREHDREFANQLRERVEIARRKRK